MHILRVLRAALNLVEASNTIRPQLLAPVAEFSALQLRVAYSKSFDRDTDNAG